MKKILSILLLLALVSSFGCIYVFADGAPFAVETTQSGDTVTVSVKTNQEITFYNFSLKLEADPAFTLTTISEGADFSDFGFGTPTSNPATGIAVMKPAVASNTNKTVEAGKEVLTFTYSGANAAAANSYAFNLTVNAAGDVDGNNLSWNKSTASATLTIAESTPTAEGYTVALSTDAASEGVTKGDTFNLKLNVTNSDSTIKDFSAFYATLKYDPTFVTFEGDTASQSDVVDEFGYDNDNTAGTLKITRVGGNVNITDNPELTLPFKANAAGTASFSFKDDVLVSKLEAAEKNADKATVTGTPLTVQINEAAPVTVTNVNGNTDTLQPSFNGSGEQTIYQKIDATIQNGEGFIPTYDGKEMYLVEGYKEDHYYYVFSADETYDAEKLSFKTGEPKNIEKTFDVNETSLTDINDAQYVYNIYNGLRTPSENVVMRVIKADTTRDQSINMSDCAWVVQNIPVS